jgi:hypothetical protein
LLVHSTQRITQRDKRVAHLHGRIRRDPAPAVNVTLKTRHQVVYCVDGGSKRLICVLKIRVSAVQLIQIGLSQFSALGHRGLVACDSLIAAAWIVGKIRACTLDVS